TVVAARSQTVSAPMRDDLFFKGALEAVPQLKSARAGLSYFMKPTEKTSRRFRGTAQLGRFVAVLFLLIGAASAHAQFRHWIGYVPERYVVIRAMPVNYYDVRPALDYDALPYRQYYLYDYVNRASSLTPEPVWR